MKISKLNIELAAIATSAITTIVTVIAIDVKDKNDERARLEEEKELLKKEEAEAANRNNGSVKAASVKLKKHEKLELAPCSGGIKFIIIRKGEEIKVCENHEENNESLIINFARTLLPKEMESYSLSVSGKQDERIPRIWINFPMLD